MKIYIVICCLVFSAFTSAAQISNSGLIWDGRYDQYDSEDPYYFVHVLRRVPAKLIGNCGKALQVLNNRTAYLRIDNPRLKSEIKNKLAKREEFTAMSFLWNGKSEYLTVLDKKFIHGYCRTSNSEGMSVYVDGFQVDIQYEQEYRRVFIVEKVYLN